MANFNIAIFASDNIFNPQNPGNLPSEDSTYMSDLDVGDQITWVGGAESVVVTVTDNSNNTFDEAQSNQTLAESVTFDGSSYNTGQVVTPTYTIVFSDSDGNSYTMTSFNFSSNTENQIPDAVFWESSIPPEGTVLTVTKEINPTGANSRVYKDAIVCFCTGTQIATKRGLVMIEELDVGDMVITMDNGYQPIRWIGSNKLDVIDLHVNPKLAPVRINAGALGTGMPEQDLMVSPQHRVLIRSVIAQRMFNINEVLIPAIKLCEMDGIEQITNATEVGYWHMLFDSHEIVYSNGAASESLFIGPEALKGVSAESRKEIVALFPEITEIGYLPTPARTIPDKGKLMKQMVARHVKNAKYLVLPPI